MYATLDLLADLGLVRRMSTLRGVALYDTRTDEHHHLLCRSCGAITDLEAPVATGGAREAAAGRGFRGRAHDAADDRPLRRLRVLIAPGANAGAQRHV